MLIEATGILASTALFVGVILLGQNTSFAQATTSDVARSYLSSSLRKKELGDYNGAMADLDRAIQIEPNGLGGRHYINRGDLRQELGDSREAILDYNLGIALGANFGVNYRRRGVAKAAIGDQLGAIDDYNTAINILSAPRQRMPDLVIDVHILRGNAWRVLGANQNACNDYRMAVSYGDQPTSLWLQSDDGAWCRNLP